MREKDFSNVSLDLSGIPSWLSIKIEIFKEKFHRPLSYCPSGFSFSIFILSLVVVQLYYNQFNFISKLSVVKPLLYTFGFTMLALLVQEIRNDYKLASFPFIIHTISNPNLSYRVKTAKLVIRVWGIRYFVTFSLGAYILFCAKKIV
ncbi:hypothetical protein GCM10011613_35880 [Cellvibrio zantedeschiae]|uniref:Uncharacterized protein n=1 Tax=Cellvibrio zantedeschiae TaxID=1237077 RepID=A0ABQ3BB51_9GAMM|nr:hypothetical protein [Cellvibrio zantedeschiae]GGY87506.1 hypothetical protein GCM10011613_35880 [Cellvibrio zantedeschiae]